MLVDYPCFGERHMDEQLLWFLAAFALCLVAAGLGYRAFRRAAAAKQESERAAVAAAATTQAQRLAAEDAARHQAEQRAEALDAARAEAARLAEAQAAREHAARSAATEAARAAAARRAAEQVARAEAARLAAQEATRAEAARVAAENAARAAALRAAAEAARAHAARLAAEQAAQSEAARAESARRAAEEDARARNARAAEQRAAHLETLRRAAVPPTARPIKPVAAKAPDQTLVMVADDSKIVRVKTGRLLAQHQYQVSYATDGLDAIQQMQTSVPDVVITDVEMPGMDGFELTRRVRQNPLTAQIPIIMITAADDRHMADAKRAGVSVLLGKPYPEEELIAHIRQAMSRTKAPSDLLAVH